MKKLSTLLLSSLVFNMATARVDETDRFHNFLLANYEQAKGAHDKAHKGYQRLLLSPDAPIHLYKGYVPLLAATRNYQQIVLLMPKLSAHFENDPDIQLIFGQALEHVGKHKEADDHYIKLSRQFKTHQEIIFQAVNSYRRNKERSNAIQVIDDLLNNSPKKPNNFIFHFMKAQLYTELSDSNNARQCLDTSLKLYPHFDKGWLLFGMLEEQAGKLDDAIDGYKKFLELSGTPNQQLERHLLELLIKRRMYNTNQKTMSIKDSCLLDGLSLFQRQEYRKGIQAIDKCLEQEPAHKEQATIIKINMFRKLRKNKEALKLLRASLHDDPHNEIWYTQLHAFCFNGLSIRHAISLLLDVTNEKPDSPLAYIHIAELHEKQGADRETIYYYQRALEYISDTHTKTRIMYNLACLYSKTENYTRMKSFIAAILKQSPDFMPARHLLAYHTLEQEHNIPLAQALLDEVISSDPFNIFYCITQARIYHANGQYDHALTTLTRARICASDPLLIDEQLHTIAHDYIATQLPHSRHA